VVFEEGEDDVCSLLRSFHGDKMAGFFKTPECGEWHLCLEAIHGWGQEGVGVCAVKDESRLLEPGDVSPNIVRASRKNSRLPQGIAA
jgi:hypothetical protein